MKRYDSYKDSGVEWIGEIPNHWKLKKVKEVFQDRNEKNLELCEDFLSITKDRGVIPYSEKGNVGNKTSDDIGKYKKVCVDDIVINPMNIIIGSVGISSYSGVLSSVYIVLESKGILSQYGSYVFQMKSFQKHLKKICYGIMELRESLNKIEFFVERLPIPNNLEQQQIVSFLDSKTSQIDELIQKKERKIELLKEYRTSLINQVVTKGLNPNVEMKDSGVEWIGEIPSHWEVTIVKYNFTFRGGSTPSTEISEYWGGNIPWISSKDVKSKYLWSSQDFVTELGVQNSSCTMIPVKSLIVVVRSGILQRTIPVSINEVELVVNQDQKVLIPKREVCVEWFYYFIKGNENRLLKDWVKDGTTVESIELRYLENQRFGLPSKREQEQIVSYLDEQTQKIDSSIQSEKKKIELLKEYRQSLISEVVTGKIDVRLN